jgi:hypothetical protein
MEVHVYMYEYPTAPTNAERGMISSSNLAMLMLKLMLMLIVLLLPRLLPSPYSLMLMLTVLLLLRFLPSPYSSRQKPAGSQGNKDTQNKDNNHHRIIPCPVPSLEQSTYSPARPPQQPKCPRPSRRVPFQFSRLGTDP